MARFITPGKSPNKYARFYKTRRSSVLKVIRISLNSGSDFGGVVDATIWEFNPNTNYGSSDNLGNPKFAVGFNDINDRSNTVIKFGGLTGAGTGTVTNAKIRLVLLSENGKTINASVLNTAFDVNSVTWNIRQTATNWNVAGVYSGTDVSAAVAASVLTATANLGSYIELKGSGLDTYVQNVLNGATDNGLLLYDSNQVTPGGTSSFYSSEAADGFRPELVFTLTPSNTNITVTSAVIDLADVSSASIRPLVGSSSATTDGKDLSNASVSPLSSATASNIDSADISTANLSPLTANTSANTDLVDVSQANISPLDSVSSATTDGADLSNANITSIVSVSGSNTDLADISAANVSPITSSSSAVVDLADISNALISPQLAGVSSNTTDGADVSNANLSPLISVSSAVIDGDDRSNGTIGPLSSVISTVFDLTDINNGQISPLSSASSLVFDGSDRSLGNVSPLASLSASNIDGQDVSNASITSTVSVLSATTDGQDISNALISPVGASPSLSGASIDLGDISNALISPLAAVSSTSIDGADVIGVVTAQSTSGVAGGKRYLVRRGKELTAYNEQQEALSEFNAAIAALEEPVKAQTKTAKIAKAAPQQVQANVQHYDIQAMLNELKANIQAQQLLQQQQYQQFIELYEQYQDEQDIEMLLLMM